jgi:hypothetical protein
MRGWVAALFGALLLLVPRGVAAAPGPEPEPPQAPILRIEAEGHLGAVPRLAIDAGGRLLASAGFDKTVRLWSLGDRRQIAVLRPPIGADEEGELYAVAVTPDGRRVFAAGATGHQWDGTFCIYVFDTERLRLTGRLPGLAAPVNDLAVSADGSRLAAGLAQAGVRVWDAATGTLLFEDRAYAGPVRALAIDRKNQLFVSAADGHVRAYDAGGRKRAEVDSAPGLKPWGLALSPDGDLLAVAYETPDRDGHLRVDVLHTKSLALLFRPDTAGLAGDGLLAVAWAADERGGVQLLAAGYARTAGANVIRRWADFGLGTATDLPAARDSILDIVPVPGGGAVYSTEDPGWGRIGGDGRVVQRPDPPFADLRGAREGGLAVSADGAIVEFAAGPSRMRFDARAGLLTTAVGHDPALSVAHVTAATLSVTDWRDTGAPRLGGQRLTLERAEISRSLTVLPGDGGFLLGTDTHLRLFDRTGRQLAAAAVPAAAWAVSAGANVAVAALLDGTIRWYGLAAALLDERAALFVHADGQRWVLFTPEGLFDHGEFGGKDLVGVHLNRERNQQPEWLSFAQAYRVLYAPAAVRARLGGETGPARARLAELGDLRSRLARQPLVETTAACLPRSDGDCPPLDLRRTGALSPTQSAGTLRLKLRLTERGLGIGALDVFVNDRNAGRFAPPQPPADLSLDVSVSLDPGRNIVQSRLYDASGAIFMETAPIELVTPGAQDADARARLFVVAIGIDRYTDPTIDGLNFAVADATSFTEAIRRGAQQLYHAMDVTVLLDAEATRAHILDALERVAREAESGDTFVFYVASHGDRDETDDRFRLIPHDADLSSWQAFTRRAIDETTLIAAMARIRARNALLFIDTCYSGKVTVDDLAVLGHETGRYLLTATTSLQEALDSYDGRNGIFVYAIREALRGSAPHDAQGVIGALSLGEYVSHRVGELAHAKGYEQDALFKAAQRNLYSFPLAKVEP